MKSEQMVKLLYIDNWGGKNYGCYPISTPGESLKDKLDASSLWQLFKSEDHVDERNDNQCDIHRGSDFTYKNHSNDKVINIYMTKSRSGKTVNWAFHCNFNDGIDF